MNLFSVDFKLMHSILKIRILSAVLERQEQCMRCHHGLKLFLIGWHIVLAGTLAGCLIPTSILEMDFECWMSVWTQLHYIVLLEFAFIEPQPGGMRLTSFCHKWRQ